MDSMCAVHDDVLVVYYLVANCRCIVQFNGSRSIIIESTLSMNPIRDEQTFTIHLRCLLWLKVHIGSCEIGSIMQVGRFEANNFRQQHRRLLYCISLQSFFFYFKPMITFTGSSHRKIATWKCIVCRRWHRHHRSHRPSYKRQPRWFLANCRELLVCFASFKK